MQGKKNPLNHSKMAAAIAAEEVFLILTAPRKPAIALSIPESIK
jgi:hypothetical protein